MAKQSRQAESYTRAVASKGSASGKTGNGRSSGRARRRGPNLRDVAKAADVSVATVSLVLNDSQRISRATKVKVRRMMDELGYQPNRLAQSLSGKYTMVLAVLLPDLQGAFADAYFGTLVSGIVDAAHARGYKVLLEQAKPDYVDGNKHVELFERRYTDGVLLLGHSDTHTYTRDFAEGSYPAVVVDNVLEDPEKGRLLDDFVMSDYRKGATQALNYLTQLGHRKIGLITAAPDIATTRQITKVWRKVCEQANDEQMCNTLVQDGSFTERGGAAAMSRLLKDHDDLTAVFATNDKMAIGAMHMLARRGVSVPDDFSVVGFDDLQHAAFVNPSLTTIHLPLYDVGQNACDRLIDRIQGKTSGPIQETLDTHLVVRDSTAIAATARV